MESVRILFDKYKAEKKRKSSKRIVCMGNIATPVLLKVFINENERCHTSDAL